MLGGLKFDLSWLIGKMVSLTEAQGDGEGDATNITIDPAQAEEDTEAQTQTNPLQEGA
jgi:hypothetical protein